MSNGHGGGGGGDHRAFLAALPAAVRADLVRTADRPGLVQAAGHLGAILALGGLIAAGVPGWWLLLLPQGVLIVFLFCAMHEASHRTVFATRWLNDALGWVAGVLLLLPPEWFRAYHLAHHRFTQDPTRDPELQSPKPGTRAALIWHCTGLPVWWGSLRVLIRNALRGAPEDFVPPRLAGRMRQEARGMLALYAVLAAASAMAGSAVLVWVWILPVLLGQPFLRVYLLAEHGRCAFVANMFENSRTTLAGPLVRRLAWNMPFHAEHHAFPAVPFHRLPDLHRLAAPHLRVTAPGYPAFARETWAAAR
jgi:fatty acid desaturase